MRLMRMLSEAGIPTLDFIEYDSEMDLTDDWQYISISNKTSELSVKSFTDKDKKLRHIEESRRIYGKDIKIYVADFARDLNPISVIVGEESLEFTSDYSPEMYKQIIPIIDSMKKIPGLPKPFSVFLSKDKRTESYKVTKFITIR